MALIFQTRGNAYAARVSQSGATPARVYAVAGNIPVLNTTGWTNELYSSSIDMDPGSITYSYLEYVGRNNTPTKGFSCNMRVGFPATTGLMGLWGFGTGTQGLFNRVICYYNAGTLNFRFSDDTSTLKLNVSGAWTPTINTYYDIFCIWDGTTSANAGKIYVDAVLLAQATASAARPTDSRANIISLSIGSAAYDVQQTRIQLNEFTLWDSAIDPTAVTLDSGTGSLNGASRSSPIASTAFDGTSYTDPGIANVRSGTSYTYAGTSQTGTLGIETASLICG